MRPGGGRGSFETERLGRGREEFPGWRVLAACMDAMEAERCLPTGEDGGPLGNAALRLRSGILVTRSRRRQGGREPSDYAKVVAFDAQRWASTYFSDSADAEPSSDTPLHWAILVRAPADLGWTEKPVVCLHGHALATEETAEKMGLPISPLETAFGSREDYQATWELLKEHPYPEHKFYLRKGHGFLALGSSGPAALAEVRSAFSRAKDLGLA